MAKLGKLAHFKIKAAKPEPGPDGKPRPKKYSDGSGLYLLAHPNGSKYWRLSYRFQGSNPKTLALGVWPDVSQADAHEKVLAAKKLLKDGIDPAAQKAEEKTQKVEDQRWEVKRSHVEGDTFREIAAAWFEDHRKETARTTWTKDEIRLNQINSQIGDRLVTEITPWEIKQALNEIEATVREKNPQGGGETRQRCMRIIGRVFHTALLMDKVSRNPVDLIRDQFKSPAQNTYPFLEGDEAIGQLMRDIFNYDAPPVNGSKIARYALEFSALVFQRPGEICRAEWAEIDWENRQWVIPAERMKIKDPKRGDHIVPLSDRAIEILRILEQNKRGRYIFPNVASASANSHMNPSTVACAMKRMGYAGRMVAHGFRHMASTYLNDAGLHSGAIDEQLAHVKKDKTERRYNQAKYLDQRREIMQFWAEKLEFLRKGKSHEDNAE